VADTENVCIQYGPGTIKLAPSGDLTINVPTMTVNAQQTTYNSPVTVNGLLTYTMGMQGSGGEGSSISITGGAQFEGGALTHNGKNIGSDHKHGGVVAGGDKSDVPV